MRGQSLYDYCMEHEDKKYLLDEWDYEKNEQELGISPKDVARCSHKKVYWVCKECDYIFCQIISMRTYRSYGCPECGKRIRGSHKSISASSGGNDFASNFPEILKEWCYERNKISPNMIPKYSNKSVWWVCSTCDNIFRMAVCNRTSRGSGCPICVKGEKSSFAEQAIYYYLKLVYEEVMNGSKDLLDGNLELDIYIPEIKTAIEYDGLKWHKDIDRDLKKNNLCQEKGIRLIRIREEGLPDVIGSYNLIRKDKNTDAGLEEVLNELFSLLGIEVDVNIERDRQLIYSQYIQSKKENSLAEKFPDITKEWNTIKNGSLTPDKFSYASNKKVWWICDKGHEYNMSISQRTSRNCGCPYCAGQRVLKGFNDLDTIYPDIAKEWHPTKNGDLTPDKVIKSSGKKVWWICDKGHEYEQAICNRTVSGMGCPYCVGKKVLNGFNDLCTTNPELVKEWDYVKNGDLTPDKVTKGSNKKVWWVCSVCGNEWNTMVVNRSHSGHGCPECSKKRVWETRRKNKENNG